MSNNHSNAFSGSPNAIPTALGFSLILLGLIVSFYCFWQAKFRDDNIWWVWTFGFFLGLVTLIYGLDVLIDSVDIRTNGIRQFTPSAFLSGGLEMPDKERRGLVRPGQAGGERIGMEGMLRLCLAGPDRSGPARRGKSSYGKAGIGWRGLVRQGQSGRGLERQGRCGVDE